MFRGTVHVIVGSGLTIVGAVACLYFTRLPYFQTLGVPAALGVLVTLVAALTLGPAVVVIASHFGLLEPKRKMRATGWRRIGTAIVRWPGPILVVSLGDRGHRRASRCREPRSATTAAPTCPTPRRPTSATRPPNGTSPKRGSTPNC